VGLDPVPLSVLARLVAADPASAGGSDAVAVAGVTLDSRAVLPGDLYAALPGARAHGGRFALGAVDDGAVAVLTDPAGADLIASFARESGGTPAVPVLVVPAPRAVLGEVAALVYGQAAQRLRMYGVTGTNGKTTTAYLLESGLRALGVPTGLIGTVETRIGDERLESSRTTPEAPDLHAILAVMAQRDTSAVVMEVSSHALAQHRVDGVVYDVALFTNLSQDHLDYHADMEDYFCAKAALFTPTRSRSGVVCIDDEWGRRLMERSEVPVVSVGSMSPADWRIHASAAATGEFELVGPTGSLRLKSHLPGTFNVVNTAMAAVALLESGYAVAEVAAAMARPPQVPGRMELVVGGPEDPRCVVDFAHTPEAVSAALAALRPTTPGLLIVVLGAGGDRDAGKRAAMGAAAARHADLVVVTDDNPRSEDPAVIRAAVLAGVHRVDPASGRDSGAGRAADIAEAVRVAREQDRPHEATVVVLGKGHERGQEIAGVVHAFDDREALAAALRGIEYRPGDGSAGVPS
jgi:UDP-N-acetylmuramoyl-L-alanyl-D-glutamate--2,6-diaminopimelate ligase